VELPVADRVKTIAQSDIRRYSAICAAMGGVNLSQGVCDQPAPPEVKLAAQQAIADDEAVYTNLAGVAELRQAIAKKLQAFNGVTYDPEQEVVVHVGTAGAFACTVLSTLNSGDEVVLFSPFYSYHVHMIELIGARVRYVDLAPPDWTFDPAELAAAFTDRTRMVVVNTPANPSGKVFAEAELKQVISLAEQHNCWVVTDEIYEYITYDDHRHVSAAALPGGRERTITISGASKTYAVTGWRVGYAAGPEEIIRRLGVVNDQLYICAPAPLQHGVLAGLGLPNSYYEDMRADYQAKRDLLVSALRELDFDPYVPQGSYYLLAAFDPGRWADATTATESILETVGVATVPGSAFYRDPADGQYQLRFCYAKQQSDLEEACDRLRRLPVAH
jgi:aminotransferase